MGNCCTNSFKFEEFNNEENEVNFNNIIKEYNEKKEEVKEEVKEEYVIEVKYGLSRKNCIYNINSI